MYWHRMRLWNVMSVRKAAYLYTVRVTGAIMQVAVQTRAVRAKGSVARAGCVITAKPASSHKSFMGVQLNDSSQKPGWLLADPMQKSR